MPDSRDEFFVGYAPTPAGLKRTVRAIAIVLLCTVAVTGILVASGQRDPGTGTWENNSHEIAGVVLDAPYPALRTEMQTLLLVDQGKHTASPRIEGLAGKHAKVNGTRIERDGFALFELADEATPIHADDALAQSSPPPITGNESVSLRGEIVDSKCHSGAMKPGDGKTHKSCAILCIRGGIPPAFVDESGKRFIIVDQTNRALTGSALDAILPIVGDFVEIHGIERHQSDLVLLCITDVRRIQP